MPRPRKPTTAVRVTATLNPAKLRAAIESSGMSQETLARAAGLPLRTVQTYVRRVGGVKSPGADKLVALARILGSRVEDWFDIQTDQ